MQPHVYTLFILALWKYYSIRVQARDIQGRTSGSQEGSKKSVCWWRARSGMEIVLLSMEAADRPPNRLSPDP